MDAPCSLTVTTGCFHDTAKTQETLVILKFYVEVVGLLIVFLRIKINRRVPLLGRYREHTRRRLGILKLDWPLRFGFSRVWGPSEYPLIKDIPYENLIKMRCFPTDCEHNELKYICPFYSKSYAQVFFN